MTGAPPKPMGLPEAFELLEESIRGACLLVEEVQRGQDTATGLHRQDALRHLALARNHAEDLRHRIDLAMQAARRGI